MDDIRTSILSTVTALEKLAAPSAADAAGGRPVASMVLRRTREAALAQSLVDEAEELVTKLLTSMDALIDEKFPTGASSSSSSSPGGKGGDSPRKRSRKRVDAVVVDELEEALEVARLRMLQCLLGTGVLRRFLALAWGRWLRAGARLALRGAKREAALRRGASRRATAQRRIALQHWFAAAASADDHNAPGSSSSSSSSLSSKATSAAGNNRNGGSNSSTNSNPHCRVARRAAVLATLQGRALALIVSVVRRQLSVAFKTWTAAALIAEVRDKLKAKVRIVRMDE